MTEARTSRPLPTPHQHPRWRIERDWRGVRGSTGASGWTSGALHPHFKIMIVMGKTSTEGPRGTSSKSMILVATGNRRPGASRIVRPDLTVFVYQDQEGHAEKVLFGRPYAVPGGQKRESRGRGATAFVIAPGPPRAGAHPPLACAPIGAARRAAASRRCAPWGRSSRTHLSGQPIRHARQTSRNWIAESPESKIEMATAADGWKAPG